MVKAKLNQADVILLNRELGQLRKSHNWIKDFKKVIYQEPLNIKTRHGNFGGGSIIHSMGVSFSVNEKDLNPPYNLKIASLSPKLFIVYQCTEGFGELLFEYNQIKLNSEKKALTIDFLLSCNPGYPGFIEIKDRVSFARVKKAFKKCCQVAGFKLKDILS